MTFTNVLENQIEFLICVESKGLHCVQQCRQFKENWGNQIESEQPFLFYSDNTPTLTLTRHYLIPEVPQLLRKCLDKGGGLGQLLIEVLHLVLLWLSVIGRVKRHAAEPREPLQVWWLALVKVVGERTNWEEELCTPTRHTSSKKQNLFGNNSVCYWPKYFFKSKLVTVKCLSTSTGFIHKSNIHLST